MTEPLSLPVFRKISRIVDGMGLRAYVIGGYVRDYYLCRPCTDIDVVVVGSGIDVAEALARETGSNVTVFKTFGTAMLRTEGMEVEFVGARKESYSRDSRKPVVEAGTLRDDQLRRDFTINALAWSLNGDTFGELEDPFGGMEDMREHIIRTPCDPDDAGRAVRRSAGFRYSAGDLRGHRTQQGAYPDSFPRAHYYRDKQDSPFSGALHRFRTDGYDRSVASCIS